MKRLLYVLWLILILLLLPYTDKLWLSMDSPMWSRCTYQLAHASVLHAGINAIGWFAVLRLVTIPRTISAYMLSAFMPAGRLPVVGWSVIICFYVGYCLPDMLLGSRLRLIALTAISFMLPGIAAMQHALMILGGFAYRLIEKRWERTM